MIVERNFPTTLSALIDLVRGRADNAPSVVLQAGHFLLYYDNTEDQILPCVASELTGPRQQLIRDTLGYFPSLTWEVGLRILDALPAQHKRVLVLVNDWQYLPRGIHRRRFYQDHPRLPASYRTTLASTAYQPQLLIPSRPRKALHTGEFFSEQTLRNQYGKHFRRMIAAKTLPANTNITSNGRTLTCSLLDAIGSQQEVYCAGKGQNCSHEVAELLSMVTRLSECSVFVNLFPLVCREYVESGTEIAFDLFRTPLRTVFNIGMAAASIRTVSELLQSCEVVIQEPHSRGNP